MPRERDSVAVTSTNRAGKIVFVGSGVVRDVRKTTDGVHYAVSCDDGKLRTVATGSKEFVNDRIMVL